MDRVESHGKHLPRSPRRGTRLPSEWAPLRLRRTLITALWKKLNWKSHDAVLVLNPPASFEPEIEAIEASGVKVHRDLAQVGSVSFLVSFITKKVEIESLASRMGEYAATGDIVLWIAYPKGTSRRYQCDFNRDNGWEPLGTAGFEPVRQVAIDEDWSALRFRRVEYIPSMKRNPKRAQTTRGKDRTATPTPDG